ncbi:unnamed protein product [Toxocara canis]|uniref:Integrase catalytic domain-containing protein n=1 Tax=Toxocara canis TaxID=6265 RepID=A0A183UMX5_TOXCA|nr:unnamed protein product [Toxocara canis]
METLTAKIPSIEIKDTEALLDAKQFDLGTGCWKKPRLLIGVDQYFHLITSQQIEKLPSGFLRIQSMVGPIIMGKGAVVSREANSHTNDSRAIVVTGIEHDVERLWRLEELGISSRNKEEEEDENALKQFYKTIEKKESGRYSVRWPWKKSEPQLPCNFGLSLGRLNSLVTKLRKNDQVFKAYNEVIERQLQQGIIEKAPNPADGPIIHYLPHQAVIKSSNDTTKIRIVYDASASTKKGCSLNDQLYRGPVLLPQLVGVLLRFRQGEIALTADIEKAFLQLELQEPDRDACRFLWLRNPDDSDIQVDRKLQTYRFCRVPFGVVSSPFLLAAVLKTHLKGYTEEKAIAKNLYVDNIFVSAENSKEAERMYKRIKDIFNEASMNVREFASNDKRVTSSIKEEDRHKEQLIKILGMKWDTTTDEMIIEIEPLERRPRTKRETLSYIAAQCDPLGLISPVILPLKLLLQDLWRKKIKWDDQFGGDETENIRRTLQGWEERREMRIPRKHQDRAWPSSEPIKNTKEEEEASLLEAGIEHKSLDLDGKIIQISAVTDQEREIVIDQNDSVNKQIKRCQKCKRWMTPPFEIPQMPHLPKDRISRATQPFESTGLDCMGPVNVKTTAGVEKRWIALFTCLSTRAVHLEVAENLSAEAFINSLRRFIARRGVPKRLLSDNGSNFVLAEKKPRNSSTLLFRTKNSMEIHS